MYPVQEIMESKSVAVIGASRNASKPGAMLLKTLQETGFQGQMAGVNPQGGEVHGVPLYRSVGEIPFPVDLAVLLIPPSGAPAALRDCAGHGVKGVVISAEGFAETGSEGAHYQEEVRTILRSTGMRGFGPNTLGIVNTETGLTSSYLADARMLKPGHIGFAAQSGIFVGALLRYISSLEGLQISKGLGLGNKVDVDEVDALNYLADDEQTQVVGIYLEDIRDGRRFLEAAGKAVKKKPVLLMKGGRTQMGARATASHTASMAVDDSVLKGALSQSGVLRMGSIDELLGTLIGFQWAPLPRGRRIALVTYSGAQAIMSVDAASEQGLEVARFSDHTLARLSRVIATPSKAVNPIDIYPDMLAHGFEKTGVEILKALLDDEDVHGIVFISFAANGTASLTPLIETIHDRHTKPVLFSVLGKAEDVAENRRLLEGNRIPYFQFPELAVRVFSNMLRYAKTIGEA